MKKIILALLVSSQIVTGIDVRAQETTLAPTESEVAGSVWSMYEQDLTSTGTEINFKQLYTNETPITVDGYGLQLKINRYAYYNFQNPKDTSQAFNGLMMDVTFINNSDQDVIIPNAFFGDITGAERMATSGRYHFNSDELDLAKKNEKYKELLTAHSEFNAAFIMAIPEESLATFEESGVLYLNTPHIYGVDDADEHPFFAQGFIPITISEKGVNTVAAENVFYQDDLSATRVGAKTMIANGEINQTASNNNVDITLRGYQVTELVPYKGQETLFDVLADGNIILTLDVLVKNNNARPLKIDATTVTMYIGDITSVENNYLLDNEPSKILLKDGEEGQKYLVFSFTDEEYALFENNAVTLSFRAFYEDYEDALEPDSILIKMKD